MSKILVKTTEEFNEMISEYWKAFKDYDLQKNRTKDNILNPILEITEYIFRAKKAGLDQREQCTYTGSILVFSSLNEMGLKYGSDVRKVNRIYLVGVKLANAIWNKLGSSDQSSKLSQNDLKEIVNLLSDLMPQQPILGDGKD